MNRKLLVAIASGALALPMAAQGVDIGASGHINRALVFSDMDGHDDPSHVDAGSSPSRFRFKGTEDFENGLTGGVNLEYGAGARYPDSPYIRHAAVSLGGDFGTLSLGHTGPATHLIGHASHDNYAWLSGTELGCDFCLAGGAVFGGGAKAYGASRMEIVKYESPSIGPVTLSTAADGNEFWDVAMRVAGETTGVSYKIHAGYANYAAMKAKAAVTAEVMTMPEGDEMEMEDHSHGMEYVELAAAAPATPELVQATVAASIMFAQGTFVDTAWSQLDPDGGSTSEWAHFGVGHNVGDSSIAATYTDSDAGEGGQSWAVGVGHSMGSAQVYAGYKYLDFDGMTEDFGQFVVGSRVVFN